MKKLAGDPQFIDVNDAFCDDGLCRARVGDTLTYFDNNHLSASFSSTLGEYFAPLVAESRRRCGSAGSPEAQLMRRVVGWLVAMVVLSAGVHFLFQVYERPPVSDLTPTGLKPPAAEAPLRRSRGRCRPARPATCRRSTRDWLRRTARRAGLPKPALRAYARAMLMSPEAVTSGGRRWPGSGGSSRSTAPSVAARWAPTAVRRRRSSARRSTVKVASPPSRPPPRARPGTATRCGTTRSGRCSSSRPRGSSGAPTVTATASADPNDIDDAAYTAARYLCADGNDLASSGGWSGSVFSYNHSSTPTSPMCTPPPRRTPSARHTERRVFGSPPRAAKLRGTHCRIMRASRLLGLLLAAFLGASLLSAPAGLGDGPRQGPHPASALVRDPGGGGAVRRADLRADAVPEGPADPDALGRLARLDADPRLPEGRQGTQRQRDQLLDGQLPADGPGLSWEDRYHLGRCGASNVARPAHRAGSWPTDPRTSSWCWPATGRCTSGSSSSLAHRARSPGPGKEYPYAQSKIFKQGGPRLFKELGQLGVDVDVIYQVARAPAKPSSVQADGPLRLQLPPPPGVPARGQHQEVAGPADRARPARTG